MKGRHIYPSVVLPVHRHLQNEEYTCGPASIRIVLETLGGKDRLPSETEIAEICLTNKKTGTDPDRMVFALTRLGVRHFVPESATLGTIEKYLRRFHLCLVDYQSHDDGSGDGHYSVIFGFDETHFLIADPYKKKGVRGKEWGSEVALGDGDVNIELYLRVLKSFGYTGPLTIEREIAHDRAKQKADIGQAVALLEALKKRIR